MNMVRVKRTEAYVSRTNSYGWQEVDEEKHIYIAKLKQFY